MDSLMQRYFSMTMFPTIILMFYNYFLINAMWGLISTPNTNITMFIAVLICVLTLISSYIELYHSNSVTRSIMVVLESWKWPSLIYLFVLIVLYLLSKVVIMPEIVTISIYVIVLLVGFYTYYKAHHVVVNGYDLELENLSEEIDIIHLSDVHYGTFRNQGLLNQVVNKINKLADQGAELAIISGDLADGSTCINKEDFQVFKNVKIPIIFTPGNHDYYPGIENVLKAAEEGGITLLDNNYCTYKDLNIVGLSYSFSDIETLDLNKLEIDANENNIIVYHIPEKWDYFTSLGFDLQLSGHTHGGQFYPANLWVSRFFPLDKGLFTNNDFGKTSYLSVSTGVGTMGPPLRWGTDAELVLLKLKPKN
ncbi:MAG: metallophosphoesterase [Methanobacteriaceae archaeon]|nr:metallophosphoesterase [Methanobacteriaceae archaeon]